MHQRIIIDLRFPNPQHVQQIKAYIIPLLPHAITINPGQPNQERSQALTQLCGHDNEPPEKCLNLWQWESFP